LRNKIIFVVAIAGILLGIVAAFIQGREKKALPPAYNPASNPYGKGIYANGIIESYQASGENINIYPEVSGTVVKIPVSEGERVLKGTTLLVMDYSIQKAVVMQQKAQAEAAKAQLEELKAEPRKENLDVARAQVDYASANLKNAQDQFEKQKKSYELNPKSVSKYSLDNAKNTVKLAKANLEVAQRQYDLTKAGAWSYQIKNQENQYEALSKAYEASAALLDKYTLKAPVDGVVLSVNATAGSYISAQGTYDTYTRGSSPVIVLGTDHRYMSVRCYVDEILINRLPNPPKDIKAKMFVRGTDISLPLEFVRIQPYVSPKIQLSDQRTERVDVRVLPIIFKFKKPKDMDIYPGQLVDVYIEQPEKGDSK
jgi:HlyD family secretion protein